MRSRHLVNPDLLPFVDIYPDVDFSDAMLPAFRQAMPIPRVPEDVPASPDVHVSEHMVSGPPGEPAVRLLIYRPTLWAGGPAIFHIHGGGYIVGSPDMGDTDHRLMVRELGCLLVSVDYRLSPETRHPGPLEDCYAGLSWLYRNAEELGVDPERIGLVGESAGAGLAAGLALLARDRGEIRPAFQHLMYPMLDDRTCSQEAHPITGEFIWTPAHNSYGWHAYLGAEAGSPGVSPYAAPARAEDLTGLPPAFIATGALDLFLEENLEYARRLIRAGIATELHVYPGAYHGFQQMVGDAEVSRKALSDRLTSLRSALLLCGSDEPKIATVSIAGWFLRTITSDSAV